MPGRPHRCYLLYLVKEYNFKEDSSCQDIEEMTNRIKTAENEYNRICPTASELREIYLGNLADKLSETGETSKESHFNALIHRESEDKKFRHIKYAEKKNRGGGVTVVEKDTEHGRIRITNKDDIEHDIVRVNKAKLVQAHDTPLMMEPLGGEGDFEKWEKILKSEIRYSYQMTVLKKGRGFGLTLFNGNTLSLSILTGLHKSILMDGRR